MAQFLVIAHAPLASALLAVAQHAYPECSRRVAAVDVDPHADVALTQGHIRRALQALRCVQSTPIDAVSAAASAGHALAPFHGEPRPNEVLVLTDVFGATPFNAAKETCMGESVRIVTGVNVPMLWRVLCYADEPLEELVQRALSGATQGALCAAQP